VWKKYLFEYFSLEKGDFFCVTVKFFQIFSRELAGLESSGQIANSYYWETKTISVYVSIKKQSKKNPHDCTGVETSG
jgi:hypothetical protein